MTASVAGMGSAESPAGAISFLDTADGDLSFATATLGPATSSLDFSGISQAGTDYFNPYATGDFNGDGKPDLAGLDDSGHVVVWLGNGDGTFAQNPFSASIASATALLAADFNGDGKLDLAVGTESSSGGSAVTVLLGNGDGTLTQKTAVSLAAFSGPSAVGDFNGDGKADILVEIEPAIDATVAAVEVLLGNGDGTFTASARSSTGAGNGPVGVADFNGDGKLDAVVGGPSPSANSSNYDSGIVTLLLGNGDGTFAGPTTLASPSGFSESIAVADLNGDGKPDLVISNMENPGNMANYSGVFLVLLGNGDGTFANAPGSPSSSFQPSATEIAVADFNEDGKPDLAITDVSYMNLSIELGKGDGSFTLGPTLPQTIMGSTLVTADFNGDGAPDLAGSPASDEASFGVLLDQPTQTATATVTGVSSNGTGAHLVEASYPGDSNFNPSTSSTVSLLAGTPAITVSRLTLPAAYFGVAYSQTLTTAGGTSPYQYALSSGTLPDGLSLSSGGVLSGTPATVTSIVGLSTFTVTATDSSTPANTNSITYALSVQFPPPAPSFTFSSAPVTVKVTAGQTASYTLSVSPSNGFSSPVTLSCGTLPAKTACSFAPATVTPGTSSYVSSVLTITTAAATTSKNSVPPVPGFSPFDRTALGTCLAALALFWVPKRFRGRRYWASLAIFALATAGALSGCGGNAADHSTTPGTPSGTYNIVVTATQQSSSNSGTPVVQTINLVLNVQ